MVTEMKLRLKLSTEERRTLREMGIYHPHARTRMRAQGIFRLAQGLTLQQVADEFEVHLNSVENWRRRWDEFGLVGLFEGRHTGRPPKLSDEERRQLGDLARDAGGTARTLQREWERAAHTPLSRNSIKGYLRGMAFRYKRCRFSLKDKRDAVAFERAKGIVASLQSMAQAGQCELLYFDETGFSPNPPLQYGWTPIGQTRCAETGVHRQRVNVLGALDHGGKLLWTVKEQHTVREDVMAFFDRIAEQPHSVPRIVVLDNANIHHGEAMEQKRRQWQRRALYLYYLPPYSPELNRIEILWKQAKYFWRKFVRLTAGALVDEVNSLMANYGTEFTINFR
jgi:transposase